MQNVNGGYENDVSVVRFAPNHFFVIGPTESQSRCMSWLRQHILDDSTISLQNVTTELTAICIMGPHSKLLLADAVSAAAVASNNSVEFYLKQVENFPFFTAKQLPVGIGNVPVMVCHFTHTGELGFVLYMKRDDMLQCYDTLVSAGAKYGIQHAGSIAVRALRIEKFFAFWGQDLDTTTTPLEVGRGFRVNYDKDFIGKNALLKQQDEGVKRRFVQLVLDTFDSDNEDIWPWGGEPIYMAGGDNPVGMTTTCSYGFTLGQMVCIGYIRHPHPTSFISNEFLLDSKFEVEIGGKRFLARINLHSPQLTQVTGTYTK